MVKWAEFLKYSFIVPKKIENLGKLKLGETRFIIKFKIANQLKYLH